MRTLAIILLILAFSASLTVLPEASLLVNALEEEPINNLGYAIATDSADNIIVTGTTESSGPGLEDVFITKYSPSRLQLWSVIWGGDGGDQGYSVAVDQTDNIIVAGQTVSSGAGGVDAFVVKYSSAGNQLWNRTWGGSNFEVGHGVAVDSANNIIVTGYTNSSGAGLEDVFIVKYSPSGDQLWSGTWGGYFNDRSYGVAIDSIDSIVVAGYTDLSGTSFYDALVLKYSSSGLYEWNLTIGGGNDFGYDVAVDSADNIMVAGYKFSSGTFSWDAFIAKCHSSGNLLWNRTWGGGYNDYSYGIALDSGNDILITGTTESFGAGSADVFVVNYSSSGSLVWNTTWGDIEDDYACGIAIDSMNNSLVTGYTDSFSAVPGLYDAFILHVSALPLWQSTWGKSATDNGRNVVLDSIDNTIMTGYTDSLGAGGLDAFVVKYSPSGIQLWNRTWGGSSYDYGYSVTVDSINNIIIAGYTRSFGSGVYDAFLAKYSPSGSQLWNRTWGSGSYDYGRDIDVDSADNIIITGYTRSFGAGGYDAFVAKYSPSGIQLWNNTWGGTNYDYGYGVALDSADNIVIAGTTQSFGAGGFDAFIVSYSSSGSQIWNNTWGGDGSDYGYDVAVDSANDIIIAGQTSNDALILKYSSSGQAVWSRMWGGPYNDCGHGVTLDAADNIVVAGETYRSVAEGIDSYVAKYSPLGIQLWSRAWGGDQSDYGFGVAVDHANNIVVAGTTESFGAGLSDAFIAKYPFSGFQFWYILWGTQTRDINITNLNPSKTLVGQGYTVQINVDATNQGEVAETFNVTTYYNLTKIGTQTVTNLASQASVTLTFSWDTSGVPFGNYTISANATTVPDEIDLVDNSIFDRSIMVTIPGDVNGDKLVNVLDAASISAHWYPGPPIGPLGYSATVDINNDGKVGIIDSAIVSAHWNQAW